MSVYETVKVFLLNQKREMTCGEKRLMLAREILFSPIMPPRNEAICLLAESRDVSNVPSAAAPHDERRIPGRPR